MLDFIQLPPGTGMLLLVTGVPFGAFLLLRRVGQFSPLAFGTISIIAFGLLYVLYQRVQASRAPDEVNEVKIEADGGTEDGNR